MKKKIDVTKTINKEPIKILENKVACIFCGGETYKFAIEGNKNWRQCVKCSRKFLL